MKIYPISLLMSFCFPVCLLYREFQCPSTPERRLRAKWFCQKFGLKEENYACLYDPILNEYQEKCNFKANILDPGEKYILHHRPTSAKCGNTNRYQPFGLQHFSDQCVYQRSMCSEAEQLRFNDGSVTVDKSCRCNGAQGYAFVTSPKRRCYCTPSTEDCSCYLKRCTDNFTLSLDYQCIHMSNKSYQASCPGIDNQESSNIDHTTIYTENFQKNSFEDLKYSRTAALFTSVGTLIMVTVFISSLRYFEKMQSIRYEQKSPSTELKAFPENGDLILTWSSQVYDKIKVNSYKIIYTSNSWINTTTISVSAEDMSCIIPDVLPMKTYRFKIASCLINGDKKLSDEHMFNSGSPSAPTQIRTLIGSGVLTLTWTSPVQNLFQVKYYKILYTSTNEMRPTEIKVDAKTLYCNIPNILPMQTYRFKILSCLDDFDGQPSEEHMFHAGTPNPPTQLKDFIENGVLTLTWTSPIENLFQVKYYKVRYTSTKETRPAEIKVDANTLYCNIPNIRPLQTYRFKILSCLNDFDGQPSEEHMFYSGKPKQSAKLTHHFGNDRNIRLVWTAAEEILFKTESYDLEYTTDGWKTMSTFPLPASELEYEIHDFTVDATYRFKLYTVSHSERSFPTEDVCIASARYYVKIQLNGIMHHDALHDATSPPYMSLREGIEQGVNATLSDCAGDNVIAELQFSRGSLYAVFILLSQRSNDEAKLRNAFEKTIKTGKFGKFMVSMEGFIFQALDNPVPPQCVRVETEYNVINILWEKPAETFFRTAHYLLQSTTDDWKTFERILIPTDQNRYCISNVLPSTKYNFKMFTVTQNDIRSIPSNEEYIVTKGSITQHDIEAKNEGSSVAIWKKPLFQIKKTAKHAMFNIVEINTREYIINRSYEYMFIQGLTTPKEIEAKYEEYFASMCLLCDELVAMRYAITASEFVYAQAPVLKLSKDEEDSIWFCSILNNAGFNTNFRTTSKRSCLMKEILYTFDSTMAYYFVGSRIDGTETLGNNNNHPQLMICDDQLIVIHDTVTTGLKHNSLLMVADSNTPTGYVKLQLVVGGIPCTTKNMASIGPSVDTTDFATDIFDRIVKYDRSTKGNTNIFKSLRCKVWPKEANEWLSRDRRYGWPSAHTIEEHKLLGIFLVRKDHPNSLEPHSEWRIDFPLQERNLTMNLSDVQHKCLSTLLILNRDIIRSECITAYHWKTCLFYVIEENTNDVWEEKLLFNCIHMCIEQMLKCVKYNFFPHYFICRENLFHGYLNEEQRITFQRLLENISNIGVIDLFQENNNSLHCYVKARKCSQSFNQLFKTSESTCKRTLHSLNLNLFHSVLEVFDYRILERCFYRANANRIQFIEMLWFTLDHIKSINSITEHTLEDTQQALLLLVPFINECLASNISAMAIQHQDPKVRDILLFGAFMYLINNNFSGRLKFISVLYACGLYKESEWYIDQADEEYIKYNPSICQCKVFQSDAKMAFDYNKSNLQDEIYTCVSFMPTELPITPDALKYEMFRYIGTKFGRTKTTIGVNYRVVIDSNVYFLLLKYLIKRTLKKTIEWIDAKSNIHTLLYGKYVRHQDVAYNVLAWIHSSEGNTPFAFTYLMSSWNVITSANLRNEWFREFNSAKLHALVILYNTWFASKPTLMHFCFHCFSISLKHFPSCSRCKVSTYCSKQCQLMNWKIHKVVCRIQQTYRHVLYSKNSLKAMYLEP
ncbi:unnamed protein product [Mytilus edulis]|uniref:Uncharacterized protein n=1 Tax=Mytilus edulis TaxID=6550 RepID=A0A8S3QA55_MYTED|nr:unnamed protein product [Mytilus edulis]